MITVYCEKFFNFFSFVQVASEESNTETSERANSATEVSTDSEFAHDDPTPTRELPAIIFNDEFVCKTRGNYSRLTNDKKYQVGACDVKLKKKKPVIDLKDTKPNDFTKVRTKLIVNGNPDKKEKEKPGIHLELQNLSPAESKIPVFISRPGDYFLSRTQSTSGIATKRALELKKKYLLGPQASIGLQKSDSASQLDTKFRTFHNNISECQKLLIPAPDISPSMQAFLENSSKRNGGLLSPTNMNLLPSTICFNDNTSKRKIPTFNFSSSMHSSSNNNSDVCDTKLESATTESNTEKTVLSTLNDDKNNSNNSTFTPSNGDNQTVKVSKSESKELVVENSSVKNPESQSPILETSIMVPNIPWKETKNGESGTDIESDSLLSSNSSNEEAFSKDGNQDSLAIPRVEIRKPCGEVMQLDSLMIVDGKYIGSQESEDENLEPVPNLWSVNNNEVIETVNTQISNDNLIPVTVDEMIKSDGHVSPNSDSGNDITAFFTDNDGLDWAVDGSSIDIDCNTNPAGQRNNRKQLASENSWNMLLENDFNASEHVCGKANEKKPDLSTSNILAYDHSDIDFMDTGSEESLIENLTTSKNRESLVNRGFFEYVENGTENLSEAISTTPLVIEAVNHHCDSPVNDRSMDFIEQGACVLNNDTCLKNNLLINSSNQQKNLLEDNSQIIPKNVIHLENPTYVTSIIQPVRSPSKNLEEISTPIVSYDLKDADISEITDNLSLTFKEEKSINNDSLDPKINDGDMSKSISESIDSSLQKKTCNSPKTSRKLEEISKEKVKQKDVIHQLVMDRMSKTSNSEKRMNRRSRSSINPETFGKKSDYSPNNDKTKSELNSSSDHKLEIYKDNKKDSLFKSDIKLTLLNDERNDSYNKCLQDYTLSFNNSNGKPKVKYPNNSDAFSLPDLPQAIRQECSNPARNLKVDSKESSDRIMLTKDNYDLPVCHPTGIVPGFRQLSLDDCSGKLVQDVKSLRKTDTYSNNDISNNQSVSYSNLYSSDYNSFNSNKKNKSRESEGSKYKIIKTVSDFFRRRDSTGQNSNFPGEKRGRLQKDKYKSKVNVQNLFLKNIIVINFMVTKFIHYII